jgi:hypothetical protein
MLLLTNDNLESASDTPHSSVDNGELGLVQTVHIALCKARVRLQLRGKGLLKS